MDFILNKNDMSKKLHYNIKPKETIYNGISFRSRLEAKWAFMFDKFGWEYQYEPSEINGYNPDFIIKCKSKSFDYNHIIVEVKPAVFINKEYFKEVINKYKGVDCHLLILNDMPFTIGIDYKNLCFIGYGIQCFDYKIQNEFEEFYMKSLNDFSSMTFMWDGMVNDYSERKDFLQFDVTSDFDKIIGLQNLWIEAGNLTKFIY